MKYPRIYFMQYGQVWSFSFKNAKLLIKDALGEGYNLDKYGKQIKYRSEVRFQIYKPLDWTDEEWQECLRDLEETEKGLRV